MEKKTETLYDMRKIHVCVLEKQGEVKIVDREPTMLGSSMTYTWECEAERIVLCVKTLTGFKHILTGETYQVASIKTGGLEVIDHQQHSPLVKYDDKLVEDVRTEVGSYKINLAKVKELEELLDLDFRKEESLGV